MYFVNIVDWAAAGNRIATLLMYVSEVEQGGATVFPHLGISLWPERGAAAFWYNLHRNGEVSTQQYSQLSAHSSRRVSALRISGCVGFCPSNILFQQKKRRGEKRRKSG